MDVANAGTNLFKKHQSIFADYQWISNIKLNAHRDAAKYVVVLLEWSAEPPPVRASCRYLAHLLRSKGVEVAQVALSAEDRLEAVVSGVALGDHLSLFLADRGHVDPYPFDAITRLKSAVGNPAHNRPS